MAVVTRSNFGEALRSALAESGVSLKELSRRLARKQGGRPEDKRRLLHRYLTGEVSHGDDMRNDIADALGATIGTFSDHTIDREQRRRIMAALVPLAEELLALVRDAVAAQKDTD